MAGRAFGSMLTSVGTDVGVLVYTGIIATAGVLVGNVSTGAVQDVKRISTRKDKLVLFINTFIQRLILTLSVRGLALRTRTPLGSRENSMQEKCSATMKDMATNPPVRTCIVNVISCTKPACVAS